MATVIRKVGFKPETYHNEILYAMDSLRTKHNKFMLPTVLSAYRKGINPVKANYQYLQDALLTKDCEFKLWFIMYVNENNMITLMIEAIDEDIASLSKLLTKYECMSIHDDSTLMLEKHYNDFNKIKIGLLEYYASVT